MGLGFAWDMSVGVLCDFAGNDRYEAARQNTQGCGAQAGLGILFDYEGNDVYLGQGQGYASPSISYHSSVLLRRQFQLSSSITAARTNTAAASRTTATISVAAKEASS